MNKAEKKLIEGLKSCQLVVNKEREKAIKEGRMVSCLGCYYDILKFYKIKLI